MQLPKPDGSPFELCPAGTHIAVCYRFIDLGTQRYEHPGGPKDQRKVMLSWELSDVVIADGEFAGEPFTYHQQYTWSMNEYATLRKHLESWRGVSFKDSDFGEEGCDIRDVLGKACMLTVRHTASGNRTYARLQSITRLLKGIAAPEKPRNALVYFTLDGDHIDLLTLAQLSEKLQAMISRSPEYARLMRPAAIGSLMPAPLVCRRRFNAPHLLASDGSKYLASEADLPGARSHAPVCTATTSEISR